MRKLNKEALTIANLRLDLKSAEEGMTWLLLPEGFRARECGSTYRLPSNRPDLQRLALIPLKPNKMDSGVIYLRRAQKEYKIRQSRKQSALLDLKRAEHQLRDLSAKFKHSVKEMKAEATVMVDDVKKVKEEAIASLNDLFSLGKQGLEEQMRAYLSNQELHGEAITAKAFRECFQMVTQAVKGLGIPSDDRKKATETIMDEAAQAIMGTKDALAMAPGSTDPETEH